MVSIFGPEFNFGLVREIPLALIPQRFQDLLKVISCLSTNGALFKNPAMQAGPNSIWVPNKMNQPRAPTGRSVLYVKY